MDGVLQLRPRQRTELFNETARRTGMDAVILEKDFWVCWTLQELFRLPQIGEHLIFKGGTSLSKVFTVIQRFSEDIDVSIDRAFLGFGGANEPEAGTSTYSSDPPGRSIVKPPGARCGSRRRRSG